MFHRRAGYFLQAVHKQVVLSGFPFSILLIFSSKTAL
ncbi:hypothetical protein [Pedobacter sp. MR2016-19]